MDCFTFSETTYFGIDIMKKLLCAIGCFVAAVTTVNLCNADIILDGNNVGTALTISNQDLRSQDLVIDAVNGGGVVTFATGGLIAQSTTTTIDIQAGEFNGTATGNNFFGNNNTGNHTFTISGGAVDFDGNLGIARDEATALLTISGGTFNVDGTLSIDVLNGAAVGSEGNGTINFTTGSTGTLTAGRIQTDGLISATGGVTADAAAYEALFTSGDLTFEGVNTGVFSEIFEVNGSTLSLVGVQTAIPEPSSLAILGFGVVGLVARRRK